MTFTNVLLVGLGGCIGSIARYATSLSIDQKLNRSFPFGTFVVNIVGAFILGLVYGWATSQPQADASNARLVLITGFCGGFTTFSAFAFENFSLITNRSIGMAVSYIALTLILGVFAVWAGIALTRKL